MKIIERNIPSFEKDNFFGVYRNRYDFVKIILSTLRILTIKDDNLPGDTEIAGKLRILVDKMSRIFLYEENRFTSFSFPFTIVIDDDNIEVLTRAGLSIDNKLISDCNTILSSPYFSQTFSMSDYFFNSDDQSIFGAELLEHLLAIEPGYLRFDHDPGRENGDLHPLNHLDINYSNEGVYKIGVPSILTENQFEDIVNITTNCRYINH